MLYAILIHQADGAQDHFTDEESESMLAEHRSLQADTKASGAFVGAVQLAEGNTASTVRRTGSRITIEDGPFAETKELLIGLYLMECADLDEALQHAARIPHAEYGAVEVRPVAYYADEHGKERA